MRPTMVRIRVTCNISGPAFSPSLAERTTGLTFQRSNEPGEPGGVERLGSRAPYLGRAEMPIQEYGELTDLSTHNSAALMALGRSIEALKRCGATALVLKIDVEYAGQCQFELPSDLLKKVADLGIPLSFACFASDETEELTRARTKF
jgi:hypothetical protein